MIVNDITLGDMILRSSLQGQNRKILWHSVLLKIVKMHELPGASPP